MVIYADLLICVNLIVNYFLLLATARFCQRKPHRIRLLLGALLGAVYALVLFVPLPPWLLMFSRLVASGAILLAAFRWFGAKQFFKEYVIFFVINFVFAGLMLALWLMLAPQGMIFNNGIVYFNINAVMLVGYTAAAYLLCELFTRLYKKQGEGNMIFDVVLYMGQKQVLLTGFVDTGNTLKDVYTGYPVAICTLSSVHAILPASLADVFAAPLENTKALEQLVTPGTGNRFKFIPYSTVGFSGILPAFLPDKMILQRGEQTYGVENVYIAVSHQQIAKGDYDILLNADIVPLEHGGMLTQVKADVSIR